MLTTIAFFVRHMSEHELPFSSRERYFQSYQEYLLAMKRAGTRAYFVTGNDSYLGGGRFARAWDIDKVSEVKDFRPVGEITADVVFEKGGFEGTDVPVVTDPRFYSLMRDKAEMHRRFGRYQPQTVLCQTAEELAAAIEAMPGDMVVVKSPVGTGGKRVYIGRKSDLAVPAHEMYPLLAQEFVDMSDGIPGLAAGPHDLRVLMLGRTILGGAVREAAPGTLHANVAQGGSLKLLAVAEIPAEVRELALAIDAELEDWPRYYSVDFAKGKQGWRMIEINDKPGLFPERTGPLAREYMDRVAHYLMEQA